LKIGDSDHPDIFALSKIIYLSNNPFYDTISANNIKLWIGNDGSCAHDNNYDGSGLYWPRNSDLTLIFYDGLVWGGKINGKTHVCGSTFRSGLRPGATLNDSLSGIWKLKKDWELLPPGEERKKYEYNYDNWPGESGAPYKDVDNDGQFTRGVDIPRVLGDEILWFVANDYDTLTSRWIYGTDPIGIEMHSSTYAYNTDELADVIFKKYVLVNKSSSEITDMYLGYWSDPDLGFAEDDYVGCDTLLSLGYSYNGDNNDESGYGINPPAVGYKILQGPVTESEGDSAIFNNRYIPGKKNLPISAFHFYIGGSSIWSDPTLGSPDGADQIYRQMQGKLWDGSPVKDVHTGEPTRFCLAGDPVAGIGWYEGEGYPGGEDPADRRMLMSSGPFNLAAGGTQEIVIAFIVARGTSNINSITELKKKARFVQEFYDQQLLTDVEDHKVTPVAYELCQNYPNPFNPSTTIVYSVPEKTNVELSIYNVLGEKVTTLVNEEKPAGEYKINFNAISFASGVYYYRLRTEDYISTRKMLLVK